MLVGEGGAEGGGFGVVVIGLAGELLAGFFDGGGEGGGALFGEGVGGLEFGVEGAPFSVDVEPGDRSANPAPHERCRYCKQKSIHGHHDSVRAVWSLLGGENRIKTTEDTEGTEGTEATDG